MLLLLTHMINTDEKFELTKGQGHKFKVQGQICNYVKNLLNRYKVKGQIDDNDTYTYCSFQSNVGVDRRSRSQGQKSRSNLHLQKKVFSAIDHKRMDGC